MAKPNYRLARRAVDEAKKKKKEEKLKRKLERKNNPDSANAEDQELDPEAGDEDSDEADAADA